VNPVNEDEMLACTPSGTPNTQYGQSWFYKTSDVGKTWTYIQVETSDSDLRQYAFEGGDCDVIFGDDGTMYSADTWLGDLSVGHSTDGGVTWTGTPLAVTSPIVDRPWLVGGPAGTVHLAYQDLQCCVPSAIWYTRSTDHGVTFTPAVPVVTASPDEVYTWEGNLVVAQDQQSMYLVYNKRNTGVATVGTDAEQVWVAASHDAGLTWTHSHVADTPHSSSYLYPSIGLDKGGVLHVVYASRVSDDQPVWYSYSRDNAASWSAPVKVLAGITAYSPWVAGGEAGEAVIEWYGSPDPSATLATVSDWYIGWGKVTGADAGAPSITSGTTTTAPLFHGKQSAMSEFNMVRLDSSGNARMGVSAMRPTSAGGVAWTMYYQSEL
jgi:hypothetical protein